MASLIHPAEDLASGRYFTDYSTVRSEQPRESKNHFVIRDGKGYPGEPSELLSPRVHTTIIVPR